MERTTSKNQILTFFLGTAIALFASACASVSGPAAPESESPPPPDSAAADATPADDVVSVETRSETETPPHVQAAADAPPVTVPAPSQTDSESEPETDMDLSVLVDVTAGRSAVLESRTAHPPEDESIWSRLRAGFRLPPLESPLIERHERWFVKNANYRKGMFERAKRYLYYIVEEVDKRDIPLEIALLPAIESAYKPNAYSRARASGLWQFIPSTARLYGLKRSWWYDGRRDVVASTRAALDYLEKLIDDFDGDWHLALAAYNAGEGRVKRAVAWNQRRGLPTDFPHLRLIKRETKHYVPKLMAMVNIVSDPERFGIALPDIPNKPYFARIEPDSQVDLGVIARLTGMELDELQYINAGYRRWATDPNGPHHLLVPVDKEDTVIAGLSSLSADERVQWLRHKVRRGDTLYDLARRYGVTVNAIKAANSLRGSLLRIGQDLVVPVPAAGRGTNAVLAANRTDEPIIHKVRRGETLTSIARRYGVLVRQVAEWNLMHPNDILHMGRKLKIWINKGPQALHLDPQETVRA